MTRHQMRENVFLLSFEKIFNDSTNDEILELAAESELMEITPDIASFFKGVAENFDKLDSEIEKYLKGWSINRISKVSLTALRVAMYEILFVDDIETDIAISEAIKITQDYTVKDDVAFVNGVLSSVAKAASGDKE